MAAAKILAPPLTAAAWVFHPSLAAKPIKGPLTTKHNHIEIPPKDAIDVPAVQIGKIMSCVDNGKSCLDYPRPIYTCKDRKRILMHDENNPPKYYCHKVQP